MQLMDYACAACDTLIRRYSVEQLPPAGKFYYHQGVFLAGMLETWRLTGKEAYFRYVKEWVDCVLDENGVPRVAQPGELDDCMAGILLFPLLDATGDVRYQKAIDYVLDHLQHIPRTREDVPWHKTKNPGQLWLDGLYMAGPFLAEYAQRYHVPEIRQLMMRHIRVMLRHTRNPQTGLMVHAYDELRSEPWADPATGSSAEHWGRANGWAALALVNDLTHLEKETAEFEEVRRELLSLLDAVSRCQGEDGRWYQVLDKGGQQGNWLENSCSCLFAASMAKACRHGWAGEQMKVQARKACEGVLRSLSWDKQDLLIGNVCVGTNVGDYLHYCNRPTGVNDLHGVGAFLLMCTAVAEMDA